LSRSAKTPRTKTRAKTKASPADSNPSKAASRPVRDQAVREDQLGSRVASKVVRAASRAVSKVGNRASRSSLAGRAKVARSSNKGSKADKVDRKAARARAVLVRAAKVVKVNQASRSSLASRFLVVRSSSKAEPDRAALDKVASDRAAKVARAESVRVAPDLVAKANPSSSAGRALAATHKTNRVDSKADLDKADLDKLVLDKAGLAKVAQDQADRVNPNNSARVLAAGRDNRVFLDNKAFPSKVALGRKACPVNRARPINSATEAPPLVHKAHE
jgi:hypothetical protein